jgi:hypothetical protein
LLVHATESNLSSEDSQLRQRSTKAERERAKEINPAIETSPYYDDMRNSPVVLVRFAVKIVASWEKGRKGMQWTRRDHLGRMDEDNWRVKLPLPAPFGYLCISITFPPLRRLLCALVFRALPFASICTSPVQIDTASSRQQTAAVAQALL